MEEQVLIVLEYLSRSSLDARASRHVGCVTLFLSQACTRFSVKAHGDTDRSGQLDSDVSAVLGRDV